VLELADAWRTTLATRCSRPRFGFNDATLLAPRYLGVIVA